LAISTILVLLISSKSEPVAILKAANASSGGQFSTGLDGTLPVQRELITPPNQTPFIPPNALGGSNAPKNLIVAPACTSSCPPIIGTPRDDIIDASAETDSIIYGMGDNDIVKCGTGNCKVYGVSGNDFILGSNAAHGLLYGGSGDDIIIGAAGPSVLVGGAGNDQLYSGASGDYMVGGPGANYFDCGTGGNGIILDFDPSHGDTKASNCKYVFTPSGTPAAP
jgi:RTX calcium-binding nonapeptide repeat (4 copies)